MGDASNFSLLTIHCNLFVRFDIKHFSLFLQEKEIQKINTTKPPTEDDFETIKLISNGAYA